MGNWEAKIYINETFKSSIIVDNSTSLNEIRNKINLNNNNDYYFISRNDGLIENEEGFNAKKVWKNDEESGYKIDLMSRDYYDSYKTKVVNLYFNMFREKAIQYDGQMNLNSLLNLSENRYNSNGVCFLSKNNIKIQDYEGLKAKDIVKKGVYGKRIDLVDLEYYKRFQVIEHLNELELMENVDWLAQGEFFIKVKALCGEDVTNAVIDELYNRVRNGEMKGSKDYIRRFRNLLIEENNENNSTHSHILNDSYEF
jgi:hypothetical protein